MPRNLDLTALRSFVAVADSGGVTRAAGVLNLTQSAVSMQLKRLEEGLDISLLDRSARTIGLTAEGEQLLSYARRMLDLNDEVYGKLTTQDFEGEIRLGAPHDIIYPRVPAILKRVAKEFPRVRIRLVSAATLKLREMFARGEVDMILTTEEQPGEGGEGLISLPLLWIGAIGGTAWRDRPVRVASCKNCIFRPITFRALDDANIPWEMAVESELDNAVEAVVSADLGIHVAMLGDLPPLTEPIQHGGALPNLGEMQINLYVQRPDAPVDAAIADIVRQAHRPSAPVLAPALTA